MLTPQSDGKRERLCFIERKDKSFVSNCRDFRREMFLFFDLANGKTKTRGLFFELPLVSLIALLLFVSFSPSFAHSSPAPCWVLPRAGRTRGGTRTRALRTQQVSTFLPSPLTCNLLSNCSLGVKAFAFPLSSPEGEGASPKPSPTKHCCSIHCTHRVKR